MGQPDLFTDQPITHFDSGVSLTREDRIRLGAQLNRVLSVLSSGEWYTVPGLKAAILQRFGISDPEPSLSAQIRNAKATSRIPPDRAQARRQPVLLSAEG
jgi:hypothetical protein